MPNEPNLSDLELFRRIANGDESAFTTTVHRFTPNLAPYIKSMVQDEIWTEDLLQDLFTKLWTNRAKLTEVENPGAWLNKMASNLAVDHLRRNAVATRAQYIILREMTATTATASSSLNPSSSAPTASPAPDPDAAYYESLLREAVSQLSPQQLKVYKLKYEEELSYDEIAARLGTSRNTVRNQLVTARETVRNWLVKHVRGGILLLCLLQIF